MSITKYFRNAVAAQMCPRVSFKDDKFVKVTLEQIEKGSLFLDDANYLFSKNDIDSKAQSMSVLIALKTIATEIKNSVKVSTSVEDLTCVFFMPASLNRNGKLYPSEDKNPWFVREFLHPMVDEEICIGYETDVDAYISSSIAERQKIDSWQKSFEYACSMFEYVTKSSFSSNVIGINNNIQTESNCYVFYDNTVNASHNILELYDKIICSSSNISVPLYNRFISTIPAQQRALQKNSLQKMQQHCGQMGCEYPLSPSQRKSLNHLSSISNGEILAISGPPGTGKTTLLQSVVANLLTQHAISRTNPPIIVASSTNNQAVTNIIDSFSKVNPRGIGNIEKRWVTVTDSFASFFPSSSKRAEAKNKHYPIDDEILVKLNSSEEKAKSKDLMLNECCTYFSENLNNIADCKLKIHRRLIEIENLKNLLLNEHSILLQKAKVKLISECLDILQNNIRRKEIKLKNIDQKIQEKNDNIEKIKCRVSEWNTEYKNLPWYIKLFPFVPAFKKQITSWVKMFKNDYELLNLNSIFKPKDIIDKYKEIIEKTENEIYNLRCNLAFINQEIGTYKSEYEQIDNALSSISSIAYKLISLTIPSNLSDVLVLKTKLSKYSIDDLNKKLDTDVRYIEFWLAVHYYECLWLETKNLTHKQLPRNMKDIQIHKLKEFSMITPCMVMTFFMLPKLFKIYNKNEKVEDYLFNYIDLLIVDEAGQTSPEIAAPSFALAKRAIIVGDEQQISPVWGINLALDETLAISNHAIKSGDDFNQLLECGLNTSQSSVMNVALHSCPYSTHDERGLFLSEHRRCYNEIISYCNELVYKGKLEPLRGLGIEDEKRPIPDDKYPIIGYFDIPTRFSQTVGTSRVNYEEAKQIVLWIKNHFTEIYNQYCSFENCISPKDILAIITPFRAQANIIKNELKKNLGSYSKYIDVGTVHTFQGGERKIIIFSTTYCENDSCQFINYNKNLMNVAVSRAKDAFWVFGSYGCLKNSPENSASGLLGKYIAKHKIL